ncbi:hypothetical protein BDZ45DRAFT_708079 [Acephala macrosclerotiorum]|nr:hypothetical protein BDZ45DRAFT_708079 [Acephala macrosclerotiorum]
MSEQAIILLPQGASYGVTIGFGFVFGIGMTLITQFLATYMNERSDHSEMFMVANRSVGTGLTASAVISSWMWATAIIWTAAQGYLYGIAAPFWYAAGCTIQIALMTVLAIHAKVKIPNGHTVLEIVKLRYGPAAHGVFIFLCLVTNILSVTSMILGAAGVITALTGMHVITSTFLFPLGVVIYTVAGGLKATFLTDYVHTTVVMILLCFLTIRTFNNPAVNGLGSLYDGAVIFRLMHSLSDFALVIMDTSFWQKGYAADTGAAMPGYMLGGIAYFLVPWAAKVGLSPSFSSFDIYRTYTNPHASDKQVIRVSHWSVLGFGIFAPTFATALHYGGIDLNWMGYFLATVICPGMLPIPFTILWRKQPKAAVIISPLLGLASGIAVWIGAAYAYSGSINVLTLEGQLPCLWGALTSTFSSAIYSIPQGFDWCVFRLLNSVHEDKIFTASELAGISNADNNAVRIISDLDNVVHPFPQSEINRLKRADTIASVFGIVIGLLTWVLGRCLCIGIFFMGWTVVSEIRPFFCLLVAVVYPLVDGRDVLAREGRLA